MSAPKHWKHQAESRRFVKDKPIVFDASDPGTGKTRVHIEHFAEDIGRGRLLVVAPKKILKSAWGNDIGKFASNLGCTYAYADRRDDAFATKSDVVAINTDGVKWFKSKDNARWLEDFSSLIIDESSYFKHATSDRSKALKDIAFFDGWDYKACMSGSPTAQSITDLWHQILVLDKGKRLGTSFWGFRSATQVSEQVGPSVKHVRWSDMPGIEPVVFELIKDITIRHDFETVMKHVPKNHVARYPFELSKKAKRIYDDMEQQAFLELKGGNISAVHAAALRTKLLQIASGAVYDDNGSYQVIDRERYELITELTQTHKHSITFYNWTHQREELAKEYKSAGINFRIIDSTVNEHEANKIIDLYQEGRLDNVMLHYKTGAHGLTLTKGTGTIWSSPVYEADYFKQGRHRIWRGDQKQVTHTLCVEAENTVEQIVFDRLTSKMDRMEDFLSLLEQRR